MDEFTGEELNPLLCAPDTPAREALRERAARAVVACCILRGHEVSKGQSTSGPPFIPLSGLAVARRFRCRM